MKVSLNTIKQFLDFDLPSVDELTTKINAQLGGIEKIIDLNKKYGDALVVKVVACKKHPDADRLNVCLVDDGGRRQDVERDDEGMIQVVCGAPNVHKDMFVVWLPPSSTVPSSYDDKQPFALEPKELRGVMSNGMLASAKELGLGDDHDGILEISENDILPQENSLQGRALQSLTGESFAEVFGLNDMIIDIENKMFTHRPDLFGQIGVAREISGIFGREFEEKGWYWDRTEPASATGLELEVFNQVEEKVPRFMVVAMKNIQVKPSPLWLQCALVAMGSKPINNIVDITNYVMLLSAQPTHAYDYDKLRGHKLGTRMAKKGEIATLLNNKTYQFDENDIVIVDGEGVVGLGGVMGGGNSEVSGETKNIVLEVANFDMYSVRKSSMRHGLFTDALTRFNKGQSPLQNDRILNLLMMSIKDVSTDAEQASAVYDSISGDLQKQYKEQSLSGTLKVEPEFINARLGLDLTSDEIEQLLRNVRFACFVDKEAGDSAISFTAPFWRTDIELPEDIVEEVGRLYGFDKLPVVLPHRTMKAAAKNAYLELKNYIRRSMSTVGANEVLTYSFVNEKVLKKAGQDSSHAYRISNALSPDLQVYRTALTPSLLDKVNMNIKAGHDGFALYEVGKTHYIGEMDETEPDVPNEDSHLAMVIASNDKTAPKASAYYQAKRCLAELADFSDTKLEPMSTFDFSNDEWGTELCAPYEPDRSAVIIRNDEVWGVVGEYKISVQKAFKLPAYSAGFEVNLDVLSLPASDYSPLSKFPSVTQDISLKVDASARFEDVFSTVQNAMPSDVDVSISPLSIYQPDDAPTKTISLRIEVTDHDKTLRDEDVSLMLDKVAVMAASNLNAERI